MGVHAAAGSGCKMSHAKLQDFLISRSSTSLTGSRLAQKPADQKLRTENGRHGRMVVTSALTVKQAEEMDLDIRKLEERETWYTARFIADDAPDWNTATFVGTSPAANGCSIVELDIEISRERVPLRNGYRHVGQMAQIRVNSGAEHILRPCCAPFALSLQQESLYRARGDLVAGQTKTTVEPTTIIARLQLLVQDGEATDLMSASAADTIEVGPFTGAGLNLRTPLVSIFAFRTVIVMAEGAGIATAKALIEATPDVGGLNFPLREGVRLYYRAPNDASVAFKSEFERWEQEFGVKVLTATREQFIDIFDGDDTLEYEPASTGAVLLTSGDEDAEKAAMLVCSEAEITEVVKDSEEATSTEYLEMRTNQKGKH